MTQETNVKDVIAMNNAIRKQRFNRFLKDREIRPAESCKATLPSNKRITWEDEHRHDQEATLKTEPRNILRPQDDSRCAAEEWLNQWRIWAGKTLRLQLGKANHTVRGDGS